MQHLGLWFSGHFGLLGYCWTFILEVFFKLNTSVIPCHIFQRTIIYLKKKKCTCQDFSFLPPPPSFCKELWKFSLTTSVFLTDIWRSHDVGMKLSPSSSASRVFFCSIVQHRKLLCLLSVISVFLNVCFQIHNVNIDSLFCILKCPIKRIMVARNIFC